MSFDPAAEGGIRGSFLLHPDDAPAVVARLVQATRAEQADRKARRADVEDALRRQQEPKGAGAAAGQSARGPAGPADSSAEESESSVRSGSSGTSEAASGSGPATPADLTRADLGRRTRLISPSRRALLGTLDGERCRFPSCTATRHLHAHHVRYWRHGGPTDLANHSTVSPRWVMKPNSAGALPWSARTATCLLLGHDPEPG